MPWYVGQKKGVTGYSHFREEIKQKGVPRIESFFIKDLALKLKTISIFYNVGIRLFLLSFTGSQWPSTGYQWSYRLTSSSHGYEVCKSGGGIRAFQDTFHEVNEPFA
jgi:hypothetical protein